MRHEEILDLVRGAVEPGETWADLGAGEGAFTRGLGEIVGEAGAVWAVDRDPNAVRALKALGLPGGARLHVREADFTLPMDLPALDGILMANALHFTADQEAVLERISRHLRPGGKLLLVEYDRQRGNPWVPHPVPAARFQEMAERLRLLRPREIGRRTSLYHGQMYAALARAPDG